MTLRTLILAASALALTAGVASTSADAAPRHSRAHAARHMAHKPMSAAAMRRGGAMRGRDGESASVDQLNAQSLAAARGGAAPAPAAQ